MSFKIENSLNGNSTFFFFSVYQSFWDFPQSSDGKSSACNAGDPGLIPELGRSPEKGMATHSSILAWRIPWTEEPDRLQSTGSQQLDTT